MASRQDTRLISALYWKCVSSFLLLVDHLKKNGEVPEKLRGAIGQFRVWAENAGAHRQGKMSLDHRLREATRFSSRVKDLLANLDDVVVETFGIISGRLKRPEYEDCDSENGDIPETDPDTVGEKEGGDKPNDSEEVDKQKEPEEQKEEEQKDDIDLAADEILHSISSLFRLTVVIQNLSSRDRLERMEKIDVKHFEGNDISHVRDKFPLTQEGGYLAERLGKANTKRRQLLKYNEQHHEKIVGKRSHEIRDPDPGDEAPGHDRTESMASWAPDNYYFEVASTANRTEITTVDEMGPFMPAQAYNAHNVDTGEYDDDTRSETGLSQTSYASSSASTSETNKLHVPNPPNNYDGTEFICQYCFKALVNLTDRTVWRKHVFRDIRPYVCTFKDCRQGSHTFEKRHDWFYHERDLHRREWVCELCNTGIFKSSKCFRDHLLEQHRPQGVSNDQVNVWVDQGERAAESPQICPICGETPSAKTFQRHLGRHMEQIALFILPRSGEEDDEGEKEDDENEEENEESDDDGKDEDVDEEVKEEEKAEDLEDKQERKEDHENKDAKEQKQDTADQETQSLEQGPEEHPDTLASMQSLAVTYKKLGGRLKEVQELEEKVLEVRRRTLGVEHPDTLRSMQSLAATYTELGGRLKDAQELQEKVLEVRMCTLGEEHPDTLSSMQNLAATYTELGGRLQDAQELEEKVLEVRMCTLGVEHPDTLSSMQNLAATYKKLGGRLKEVQELEEKVLEGRRRMLGEEHPDTLRGMQNLALTLYDMERPEEAISLMEKAACSYVQIYGSDHSETKDAERLAKRWKDR
ncbi:Similar to Nephrocystin-3; acc. no. Q7Z494, partial [Pyronema omphalodes CBS 100304]